MSTYAITFINSQSIKLVFNEQPASQVQDPKGFEYIVKLYYRENAEMNIDRSFIQIYICTKFLSTLLPVKHYSTLGIHM